MQRTSPGTLALSLLLVLSPGTSCGARSGLGSATSDAPPPARDAAVADLLDHLCPQAAPPIGAACSPDQLRCNYERCLVSGISDVTFLCNAGSWFFEDRWPCLPNPDGCPGQAPEHGAACSLAEGSVCRFGPGSKGVCEGGRWRMWRR